jgi:hypothetical protein
MLDAWRGLKGLPKKPKCPPHEAILGYASRRCLHGLSDPPRRAGRVCLCLFGETAAERAKETGGSPRTLHYQARRFEQEGMASLFPKPPREPAAPGPRLPQEMCQLIVNRKRGISWL